MYLKITPIWEENDAAHDLFVVWKKMRDSIDQNKITAPNNHQTTEAEQTFSIMNPATNEVHSNAGELVELPCTVATPINIHMPSTSAEHSNKEKLAKVLSPETGGANVPSPFKNHLFWPGTPTKSKRKTKETAIKLPAVVSGSDWQKYEEKRMEKKRLEEQKKQERKRSREEKKIIRHRKNLKLAQ